MDDNAMLVWKESNKQFHLRKIKAENEEKANKGDDVSSGPYALRPTILCRRRC